MRAAPDVVSCGIPEKGDAKWLDHEGSFMAAVAAQPVFRLLGAKGLGVPDDYHTAKMPPVNVGLLAGQLAWRQNDAGHTDAPNWRYFIPWADSFFDRHPPTPADRPLPRTDANSKAAHLELYLKAHEGKIRVYFEGDSIARRWDATDYPDLLDNWKQNFFGWDAWDFGWGADRTQNILRRLENGELDSVNPKVIVLLAGTNSIGNKVAPEGAGARGRYGEGVGRIVADMRAKAPDAVIVVTAIFPRNDNMAVMREIDKANAEIAKLADDSKVRFLSINDKLADADGKLYLGMMKADQLHPALKGYQVWADALKPIFAEILGPPAAEDHAPPATGNPPALAQPPGSAGN